MDMEGRKVGEGEKDALFPRKWEEAATVAGFALGFGALSLCLRTLAWGWGWGRWSRSLQVLKGVALKC